MSDITEEALRKRDFLPEDFVKKLKRLRMFSGERRLRRLGIIVTVNYFRTFVHSY